MAFRLDQAPLVDFCNQHSPRAHSRYRPTPASWWNERALAHVARRPRHGEAAGCAGELYPSLSARASHDDGSLHPETGGALAPAPLASPLAETHDLARPLAETRDREPFRTRRNRAGRGLRPFRRFYRMLRRESSHPAALTATSRGSRARSWHALLPAASLAP
jgi:hypothetical protein